MGRYLSQHLTSQKKSTIIELVDRIFLLSNSKFHQKNSEFVIKVFLENDYPLGFIFDTIQERIKSLVNKKTFIQTNVKTFDSIDKNNEKMIWFTLPYINSYFSDKLKSTIENLNSRLSFFSINQLNSLIKLHKNPLSDSEKENVVYKISFKDCDAIYVGQTER